MIFGVDKLQLRAHKPNVQIFEFLLLTRDMVKKPIFRPPKKVESATYRVSVWHTGWSEPNVLVTLL